MEVKEGVSRSAARCVPLTRAREMIENTATEAVKHASDFKPFVFNAPATVQVVFVEPSYADTLENLDFVTRVDGRTIHLEAEDFLKAFERFNALHFLAPAVR